MSRLWKHSCRSSENTVGPTVKTQLCPSCLYGRRHCEDTVGSTVFSHLGRCRFTRKHMHFPFGTSCFTLALQDFGIGFACCLHGNHWVFCNKPTVVFENHCNFLTTNPTIVLKTTVILRRKRRDFAWKRLSFLGEKTTLWLRVSFFRLRTFVLPTRLILFTKNRVWRVFFRRMLRV